MTNTKNNLDMAEIARLKKEIDTLEADYSAMDSEEARNEDRKAAYGRYMRQAEGVHPFFAALAAVFVIVFAALLGYSVLESINGNMDSSKMVVNIIICALCVLGVLSVFLCDITKRRAEAKMRLSSHMHRYDTQLMLLKAKLEELKEQLLELEKNKN